MAHGAAHRMTEYENNRPGENTRLSTNGQNVKIALVHKRLELRGGTERVLYRTAEGLRDRGHEIHLFCGRFLIPPPEGVFAHRVPCISWPRTARLLSFAFLSPKFIAQFSCDAVMSFDHITRQDVYRSGGGPHRLFIKKMAQDQGGWKALWYRISPYHRALLIIEKWQMSAAGSRKIIAVCQQVKREIVDTYRVPESQVVVIHNGVDHERFHPHRRSKEGKQIRSELGIPADCPVVLFVGTGFRRKGLDRLLRLWNDRELEGVCLLVVGNDSRLSSYRKRWSRKEVVFVGPQLHVESYYAAANLFVLPSIQEAFGNVVLEALASGLPVITVAGVGPTDKMEGELREGILGDPDDPIDLKTKILQFLHPARWSSLSQQARQLAEEFSWQRYLEEVENCLGNILAARTAEPWQSVHSKENLRA